jgi:hypothetical protein
MTIRRWMVTVAFVAAIITAGQIARRSLRFHRLAAWHQTRVDAFVAAAAISQPPIVEDTIAAAVDEALQQIEEDMRLWRYNFDGGEVGRPPITAEEVTRDEELLHKAQSLLMASQAKSQQFYEFHVEMSRKYRRAATQPWLPVPQIRRSWCGDPRERKPGGGRKTLSFVREPNSWNQGSTHSRGNASHGLVS